jgi:hypothetical protein
MNKTMSNTIKNKMRTVLSETKDLMSMRPILQKHGLLKIDFTFEPVCMFTFKVKGCNDTIYITNKCNVAYNTSTNEDGNGIVVGQYACGIL